MLNSIELLPKSMLSSSIIEQIIKYFSDWRVDSVKEAIKLYYNEAWRNRKWFIKNLKSLSVRYLF